MDNATVTANATPRSTGPLRVRATGLALLLGLVAALPGGRAIGQDATPTPVPAPAPASAPAPAGAPAQVMIVGTWHFDNPGLDMHNVEAVDVMTPERQAQIVATTEALARFRPTVVAVEWPAAVVDERYPRYRAGTLDPSANEVVQLGFRLADSQDLARVHGIDMPGEFPFEPIMAWATANGREAQMAQAQAAVAAMVQEVGELQGRHTIGEVLYLTNAPDYIDAGQAFYMDLLRYGSGDDQPGAELNAAWARRNFLICARLLQALKPGDRAVVLYGSGHAHALRRCAIEASGVDLVEATDYLPRPAGRR
jgi:hypothetical protein